MRLFGGLSSEEKIDSLWYELKDLKSVIPDARYKDLLEGAFLEKFNGKYVEDQLFVENKIDYHRTKALLENCKGNFWKAKTHKMKADFYTTLYYPYQAGKYVLGAFLITGLAMMTVEKYISQSIKK